MSMDEKEQASIESLLGVDVHYTTFGERLREIRKAKKLSQNDLAEMLGMTKQMVSSYELNQRSPRLEMVRKYADTLGVPVDYLLGDTDAEAISKELWTGRREKPFYKIFIEITYDKMGLDIDDVVRITGLTDRQIRTIITRQMKVAPLDIAMQLSETLNVPLEVWLGIENYAPMDVSAEAFEVARAYDKADFRDKNMARMSLKLELLKEETV